MRKLALVLASALALATPVVAAEGGHIEDVAFPWEGPFGKFDQLQLQRGLQVYTEVCSACHGLQYVPIRTLGDPGGPGLPVEQVRAYATEFSVLDEEANRAKLYDAEAGEMRALIPSDNFPANHTAGAPDLSLIAKSRAGFSGPYGLGINQFFRGMGGPEYIHAVLTGYTGEEKEEAGTVYYENTAFAGGWIAMAPPLSDDLVEFDPAHAADLDSLSMDVAAFLTWAAEPKMMARKQTGFIAVGFLILLTALLYLTNKKLWAPYKRHA